MKFSVLISCYNKDKPFFLKLALKSIWDDQSLKPNEIVIVEDGPLNDKLRFVIDEFSSKAPVKSIKIKKNKGLGNALNEGLKKCSNKIVARMDADDISKPTRFFNQINIFKNNQHLDLVGSFIDEFHLLTSNVISVRKVPELHHSCVKNLKYSCPFNHPSVMFKKQAVLEAGGYIDFFLKEDLYLWLRMYHKNSRFYNIQESLLFFRVSKNMYRRRRGFKYAKSEFRLFMFRHKINLINRSELLFFGTLTFLIRLIPAKLINYLYILIRKF